MIGWIPFFGEKLDGARAAVANFVSSTADWVDGLGETVEATQEAAGASVNLTGEVATLTGGVGALTTKVQTLSVALRADLAVSVEKVADGFRGVGNIMDELPWERELRMQAGFAEATARGQAGIDAWKDSMAAARDASGGMNDKWQTGIGLLQSMQSGVQGFIDKVLSSLGPVGALVGLMAGVAEGLNSLTRRAPSPTTAAQRAGISNYDAEGGRGGQPGSRVGIHSRSR